MVGNQFGNIGSCSPVLLQFFDDAGVGCTPLRLDHRLVRGSLQQRMPKVEMMVRLQTAGASATSAFARTTGLVPDFELHLEWDTPLFILDYSFLPKHLDQLFLTDHTIGIKWRYSY